MGPRPAATWLLFVLLVNCTLQTPAHAQARRDTVRADPLTAGESDGEPKRRTLVKALNADLGFTTFRLGGGLLFDAINYAQDSASLVQFPPGTLRPDIKLRDVRIVSGGRFKTRRAFTWQAGLMWDQVREQVVIRQTGIMLAVPEIYSHFFIGRAKEGFSLNKVMVGYDGWTMERAPFSDATIPLLADGIKWLGSALGNRYFWNMGVFFDALSEGQSFSTYNRQFVLRAGVLPLVSDSVGTLLHIGMNFRIGDADKEELRLKSKPEAFEAPVFIDTGTFPAGAAREFGPEIYFRPGRFLIGGEYYWMNASSTLGRNPWFHGGEVVLTWLTTGETRSYNTTGHYFRGISPDSTVIQGGPGAWELVLKFSYADLDDAPVEGGIFWRFTPMLNWYLTDNLRLEFAYGYGKLRRFGAVGITQFFQSRIQFQL